MQKEISTLRTLLVHANEHHNPFKWRSLLTAKLLASSKFLPHTAKILKELESRINS